MAKARGRTDSRTTRMDAARVPPREEDEVGSSPVFSHNYRITVEEPDGSRHEHELNAPSRARGVGCWVAHPTVARR